MAILLILTIISVMKRSSKIIILRVIKYSAKAVVGLVVCGEAYLFIVRPDDDIAGGVFMGLLMIFVFGTISIVVERYERKLSGKR